jgi:signal transduction histidine kinase
MKRKSKVLLECLKQFVLPFSIFCIYTLSIFLIFWLYEIKLEPFFYASAISFFFLICAFIIKFLRASKNLTRQEYEEKIEKLNETIQKLSSDFSAEQRETQDFYITWVHQIKTPIAVLKLELDKANNNKLDRAALQEELFRIEQYTDMVLSYQRLGSNSNDLLVKEYSLDELIREVIRKYASQFIHKKLKLEYAGCSQKIVIDKKWFICILEQLISNAIKYTKEGSISITVEEGVLSVRDTGIGIAREDIPRIFEKGYTGANGRLNEKSSGLGLYLCSKAASLQNLTIQAQSQPGKGSCFSIDLKEKLIP